MTDRGERPAGRHGGSHGPAEGDVVLGRDGKPLLDRYGRPVRRRPRTAPDRARESGRHSAGGGRHAKLRVPRVLHVRRVPNGLSGLNAPSVLHTLRALNTRCAPTGKIRGRTARRLTGKSCAVNALFMMRNGLILLGRAQITMLGMVHVRSPGTTTRVLVRSTASNCTSRATNSGSLRSRPAWTWADQ